MTGDRTRVDDLLEDILAAPDELAIALDDHRRVMPRSRPTPSPGPSPAYDTGEWLHTGLYTLFPGDAVLLFTGSAADAEAIATIHDRGAVVVTAGAPAPADIDAAVRIPLPEAALRDPAIRALVEPVIGELLAHELWCRTRARA